MGSTSNAHTRSPQHIVLIGAGLGRLSATIRQASRGYRVHPVYAENSAGISSLILEGVGLILGAFVPFQREVSVVAVRGRDGEFRTWPLTENWHDSGILSASLAPATLDTALAAKAVANAHRVAEALDYVGVFALELFLKDGELLANEMAPRVHNSGHWTIEGAETSQFQNHLRAVLGLALGDTRMLGHACMLNWIGAMPAAGPVLAEASGHWHDYGKSPREGRKVGHATFRADTSAELAAALARAGVALDRQAQVAPVIARLQA